MTTAQELRARVKAEVEHYLTQTRGASAPASVVTEAVVTEAVATAVERALEARKTQPACAACALTATPAPKPASDVAPPAPSVQIAEFVCESDVRAAIATKKKIFIGPRSIVTPSARDLAQAGEVLVRAQR